MNDDLYWRRTLVAWLHDPPDKSLNIPQHEKRALRYLRAALGQEVDAGEIKGLSDQLASAFERLPLPTYAAERSPDTTRGIRLVHPLSGESRLFTQARLDEEDLERKIRGIVEGIEGEDRYRRRFLALWRLLPEKLDAARYLPADTRIPDHTIVQHMDTAAGIYNALNGAPRESVALLSFKLGPVQSFIEAARSTLDLLSGSYILAWLVFEAMKPVLNELGPTALVYPSLRGAPLADRWLHEECGLSKVDPPDAELLKTPSLPNRFLAVVPYSRAEELAKAAEQACREAWQRLADDLHAHLNEKWNGVEWDRLWQQQVDSFFSIQTAYVKQADCTIARGRELFASEDHRKWFGQLDELARLQNAIPEGDRYRGHAGQPGMWQMGLTFSAALMSSLGEVRHIPDYRVSGDVPGKCSLLGTYEQMGPARLTDSDKFWEGAQNAAEDEEEDTLAVGRIKPGERLSAISLVKRFAFPASLQRRLKLRDSDLRFPDTRGVAKAAWDGKAPPNYYAILMFDGDQLGKWLDGRHSPATGGIYDERLRSWFERLPGTAAALASRRPVGPALHAAISEALGNFSLLIAPKIIRKHQGTLVYSGGDDVLALLPVNTALACARELRLAYSGATAVNGGAPEGFYGSQQLLTMGPKATASAGIAVAHYKEDMRLVLAAARAAEKRAKTKGRDRLGLTIMRRSGEHSETHCSWDAVEHVQKLVQLNLDGASDRWAYQLRGQLEVLNALDGEPGRRAQEQEVTRLLKRSEGKVKLDFSHVQALWECVHVPPKEKANIPVNPPLTEFTALCQSASFLARGRDDR